MSISLCRIRPHALGRALLLVLFLGAPVAKAQVLGDLVDVRAEVEDLVTVRTGKKLSVGVAGLLPFTEVTGLAVEIGTSSSDIEVSIRFLDGPDADEWIDLYVVPSAAGGTAVAGWRRAAPFEASRFEIRAAGPPDAVLEIREVGFFDARMGEETPPSGDVQPMIGAKTGSIVPPPLVTRAQWSAKPFIGSPSPLARPTYDFMTWHHAAGYSAENLDQGKAQMRAMQDLHQNVRGWSDIGYQFAIDRAGNLYQGRPFMDNSTSLAQVPVLALGAHAGGANTGNIGVVIMGCYHPPEGAHCEQEITPAAFATYINLFAFLSERYGVEPEMVRGHRDFGQTACPGDNNYELIPELISRVSQVLITGNEPLGEAEMSGSVDAEGVVSLQWSISADFGIEQLMVERISPSGTVTLPVDASVVTGYTDASLAGESSVTYLLIASHSDGRRQELARVELDIADPIRYLMTSAFPNPASDAFDVRYFLSAEGFVSLTLHDARGRELSRHEPGFMDGDQWVSRRYDVSSFAAGVYYLRLRIRSFGGTAFDRTIPIVVAR